MRKAIWVTEEEEEKSQTEQIVVFAEIPYQISLKEYEKTGLDVIFFGQEHVDTMSLMQEKV